MMQLAFWNSPAVWVVLIIVLVLFGGAKIPEMMKGLGQGVKELKKGMNEDDDELAREKMKEQLRAEIEAETKNKK